MDEYLQSKPMLTSGVLGATTTIITGTLAMQFGLPGSMTALIVSFLLCTLVFSDKTIPALQRIVFYFINSLIVFTTAIGINTAGVAAIQTDKAKQQIERSVTGEGKSSESTHKQFFHSWF